jgi:hypothetical protein
MDQVLEFLQRNRRWNEAFQNEEYRRCLGGCIDRRERLRALLHMTVNSQSQPSVSKLARFWQTFEAIPDEDTLSLFSFTAALAARNAPSHAEPQGGPAGDRWRALYEALRGCDGWGPKTSALFVKNVINVHRGPSELHFWTTAEAATVNDSDELNLPVDAVIVHLFEGTLKRSNFNSVNGLLRRWGLTAHEILLLDDLWFWGFLTQEVRGKSRHMGWNPEKFWAMLSMPKGLVGEVESRAGSFVRLVDGRAFVAPVPKSKPE